MFLHTYSPQPTVFTIGPFSVYWYGLLIVVGILLGLWLTIRLGRRFNLKSDDVLELFLYLIIFGLLGGRLYHIFLQFNYYTTSPLSIFKVWEGGLAIHGVLAGGIITLFFWSQRKEISFWLLADLLAPAIILGQAIGRWGNYFNQELFGRPTDLPWGIPIDQINRPLQFINNNFFHPTFLYESLVDFLIFIILIFLHKKQKLKPGSVFLFYLIFYSVVRFMTEFLRLDPTYTFGWLRWPQIVSLAIIAGAIILIFKKQKIKNN